MHWGESRPSFLLFVSIWTLVVALPFAIFAPKHAPKAAHPYALMAVEVITTIFWFSGFIALASLIRWRLPYYPDDRIKAGVAFGCIEWYCDVLARHSSS